MIRFLLVIVAIGLLLFWNACHRPAIVTTAVISEPADWFYGRPLYEVYVRAFTADGSLNALRERLPQLKGFGIRNLWLMPIHPIGEKDRKGSYGSPYSIRDYFAVGDEYGSMDDLKALVAEAHRLEMRVMLDMVMNHSANDHIEIKDHPDWYLQDAEGNFNREVADWSDVTDWNFDDPAVSGYLEKVLLFYVQEVDVDGFRCDVAGMVPDPFWKGLIPKLRRIKPDLYMLAEWYSVGMIYDGFHSTYDWDLYHRLRDHRDGKITLDSLWGTIERWHRSFPPNALPLRFIENHDELRCADRFGYPGFKPYAALIFTLPGVPLLYNGQEVGATHKPSLFEREPIDWHPDGEEEVRGFYRQLIAEREHLEVLRRGDLKRLKLKVGDEVLIFQRSYRGQTVVVAINFSARPFSRVVAPDVILNIEPYGYQLVPR